MKDLKQKTLRGGLAKVFSQGTNFAMRMGSMMLLARLLDPKDFGLVGMVTAIAGVFSLFKDAGLSMATIQRDSITAEESSTLFWINVSVGIVLALLLIASAPGLVAFYHEPRLFWITVGFAADFIFTGLSVQHNALLLRQMRFTTQAAISVMTFSSGILVAISLALAGFGYWALVGQAITVPIANAICLWVVVRWIPGKPQWKVKIRSMIRFGALATSNSLVVYIAYNVEKVLLGRIMGAEALGIYGRAYQLINIPTENLNSSIGGLAFSALSRTQNDPDRFRSYFLKGYSTVVSLTMPATCACFLFAKDLIMVILGPKWKDCIIIFQMLAPTIMAFALINPFGWLLFSLGMAARSLKIALLIAPVVITGYIIGLSFGLKGVALGYSCAMTLLIIPCIAWAIHGTMVSGLDVLRTLRHPFFSALAAIGISLAVHYILISSLPLSHLVRLLLEVAVFLCGYLFFLLYVMGQKSFYLSLFRGLVKSPS